MKITGFVLVLGLLCTGNDARAQESMMLATCRPASERTGPVGCWIIAHEPLGEMPAAPLFWHLSTYASRTAADAEKVRGATVVEALDKVWMLAIAPTGSRTPGGTRVAEIGPLVVKAGTSYTAQYMEAIFPPGARTRPHTHPGPEAWYHEAGGGCLKTPERRDFRRGGGNRLIRSSRPAQPPDRGGEKQRPIAR